MNYQETLDFMYSQLPAFHRLGKAAYKSDLHNTISLDNYFGQPHRQYKTIHIGGTNGKGSVSSMTSSMMMEAGYRTGLYTSPHLKDFRERIRVNGGMISKDFVTNFIKKHSPLLSSLKPSFFEMTVAMAFEYFRESAVDVAVIEVGLGGRLDSTNIITPELSVITNIGHDHMDLLGDTPEKIAFEKAGIIKESVPVIIGESLDAVNGVFMRKARETNSDIYFADKNFHCTLEEFDYSLLNAEYYMEDLRCGVIVSGKTPLGGDYQAKNLQTMFQVFSILEKQLELKQEHLLGGIEKVVMNTGFEGRWQIIGNSPLILCDTGHNREGLEYVMSQLSRMKKSLHIVIGFVNDKDLSLVLPLMPADARYYFTRASVPRALDEKILLKAASEAGLKGESYPDVRSALNAARKIASSDDVIFVGGSTFVVAEAL